MEIQVLYYIEYSIPRGLSYPVVERLCYDNNITMEKSDGYRIFKFFGSNEHNIRMLRYRLGLEEIVDD